MSLPVIGITMGDIAGIGPEVIVKSLASHEVLSQCIPVVIGSRSFFNKTVSDLNIRLKITEVARLNRKEIQPGTIYFINSADVNPKEVKTGIAAARWGKNAFLYVEESVKLAKCGRLDAIVTGPVSKEGIQKAGYDFEGHTDFLAYLTGTKKFRMMFAGGGLKVVLATIHISLRDVLKKVTKQSVAETIKFAANAAVLFGIRNPRIAVAGLNPHAGEGGLFGGEEIKIISPAIKEARESGLIVIGPMPPDTVFLSAYKGEYDFVVALYHDQGLIAFKMVAFDKGVNITLGLPFIRTSPDHGTAYNIAGKGIADPGSMKEAINIAAQLAKHEKK